MELKPFSLTNNSATRIFRCLIFFALTLISISLVSPARANLQFDVFLGYDGVLPHANWFPVVCELKNDGPPFSGVIEISPDQFGGGQTHRVLIELPTGTLKRICVPAFSAANRSYWNARLLDQRGKVRAEQLNIRAKKTAANEIPVVAAVSRTLAGAPNFPTTKVEQTEFQPTAARLQPSLFPDNPLALEGVELLYLNSEKALDLNIAQANALLTWIQGGGQLVVGVENIGDVNANRWLRELLPCDLTGSATSKSPDAFQNWLHAEALPGRQRAEPASSSRINQNRSQNRNTPGKAAPQKIASTNIFSQLPPDEQFDFAEMPIVTATLRDAKVVIGSAAQPLAIESARGRGRVTVLLFSPEREPFVSWKNRPWFWTKLAGVPTKIFETADFMRSSGYFTSDGIFGAMIDSKQIRKLPLGWLLLLLVAYLLVIGPFDQFWLKKINKQMLTWITFPCYVLFFSGLIYFIGFKLRAGDSEWNELSVIDILPHRDGAVLRGQTYASIYSPANSRYALVSEQPFATLRGEFMANAGRGLDSSRANIVQRGNNFEAEVFVPVWTSQLFVSDWLQPAPTPLTMTAVLEEGVSKNWKVTVENMTNRKLTETRAVLGGRVFELGELPPNQTKTFSLESSRGILMAEFLRNTGNSFFQAVQSRQYSFGNRFNIENQAVASMTASFLSQVNQDEYRSFSSPGTLDLSRFAAEGKNILLAWDADHSFTPALNRFTPSRLHKNTLLRLVQ